MTIIVEGFLSPLLLTRGYASAVPVLIVVDPDLAYPVPGIPGELTIDPDLAYPIPIAEFTKLEVDPDLAFEIPS